MVPTFFRISILQGDHPPKKVKRAPLQNLTKHGNPKGGNQKVKRLIRFGQVRQAINWSPVDFRKPPVDFQKRGSSFGNPSSCFGGEHPQFGGEKKEYCLNLVVPITMVSMSVRFGSFTKGTPANTSYLFSLLGLIVNRCRTRSSSREVRISWYQPFSVVYFSRGFPSHPKTG